MTWLGVWILRCAGWRVSFRRQLAPGIYCINVHRNRP